MESSAASFTHLLYSLLTPGHVAVSILFCVATQWAYQIVYNSFFHPLAKFPGPFWGGVTRLWIAYHDWVGQETKVCEKLLAQYGPVARITPSMVYVSPCSALPTIYSRHATKAKTYISGSFGDRENLFNVRDWKQHAQMRKVLAGPYSFSNVKKMEPLFDNLVQQWIDKISADIASKEGTLDLNSWSKYLTFDVMGEVGFGTPFGFIENASDVNGMLKAFREGMPMFGLLGRLYPFTIWIKKTWVGKRYLVAKPEDSTGWGFFMRLRDNLIDQRKMKVKANTLGNRVDVLQSLLEARTDDGKPLDPEYIKAEILLILLAGADTTGTALQSILHYILADQSAYEKVVDEMDRACKAGLLSAIPSYDEVLQNCPYYVACLKEALRLSPSTPNIFARLAGPEGVSVEGMHIPGGTEIACNPWILGRDKTVYGPEADKFRPERWLESEEQTALFEKNSFVFGYGTRSCLGKEIALMELYKAPLQFLRKFRVHVKSEGAFESYGGLGYWRDNWVRLAPRAQVGREKASRSDY